MTPPDQAITAEEVGRLRAVAEAATPGPWSIWEERCETRYDAIAELTDQVQSTEPFIGSLFLLNASSKRPATTGCGPSSAANAAHIATFDPPMILRLLDALDQARGGWLPIETAPKGEAVLIYSPDAEEPCIMLAELNEFEDDPDAPAWYDRWSTDGAAIDAEPTHWRSLPAPPSPERPA